ncbi:MAG: ATP-binding protein [Mesorhizobium sp.]
MSGENEATTVKAGRFTVLGENFASARWLLGAALIGLALVIYQAAAPWSIAAAVGLIFCAALLGPARDLQRSRANRVAQDTPPDTADLSAEDLAAAVDDPLIVFDRNGTVLKVNPACSVAFPGVAAGTSLSLRFRAPEILELVRRVTTDRRPGAIDYLERVPSERWFRVSVSPAGAEADHFVMSFRDQSETRRIDRMRADFIANASHELRTPLASIAGFIETLRGPARNDAGARDQFLQIMQSQTDRMARLIDDLLSLSRLEMKTSLSSGDQLDLTLVIKSTVDALRLLAQENGVEIHFTAPASPAMVVGARDELIQVFENLIENGCKYGRTGELVEVDVTQPGRLGGVDVTVRDHGPGIPEEHIPRLTERFYRVDVETSRGQKGTGLGLAIVKHILTRHNARLTIASRPGEGAAFTVHFPPAPKG